MLAFSARHSAPQAGTSEQVGRRRDHRLALIAVGDFLVDLGGMRLGLGQQRRRQLGSELILLLVEAGQLDTRQQRLQPVGARQRGVGLEALQRHIELRDQCLPVRASRGGERANDVVAVVAQHVHLRTGGGRVCQHLIDTRAQGGVGLQGAAAFSGGQRLQPQARGRLLIDALARRSQLREQRRTLRGGHQLLLIGFPRIEAQQLPLVGGDLLAGLRVGQHGLHRTTAGQAQLQHAQHLRRIDFARQPREFLAVVAEQDHGRVAAHLETRPGAGRRGCRRRCGPRRRRATAR